MKELQNINLEEYLKNGDYSFDRSGTQITYFSIYEGLKSYLVPIHQEVTNGSILEDIKSQINKLNEEYDSLTEIKKENLFSLNKIRWLNDHGPNHINTVIKRATQLLSSESCILFPREIFFILSAIQLHDVGNIFGRIGHERRILEVIEKGKNNVGTDRIDQIWITKIAEVHGGTVNLTGSKDTISQLDEFADYDNEKVRLRLLASILRFADELAEEKYRGSSTLLDSENIPKGSEVFHLFSICISSISVDHSAKTVKVQFHVNTKYLNKKFGKGKDEIFIIDEIYNRLLKMHLERIYCSRYWKPYIELDKIFARIIFYPEKPSESPPPELTFTLEENGYPTNTKTIFELCPDLIKDGVNLDGDYFDKLMTKPIET